MKLKDQFWDQFESPCPFSIDFMKNRTIAIGTQSGGFALTMRCPKQAYICSWEFKFSSTNQNPNIEELI